MAFADDLRFGSLDLDRVAVVDLRRDCLCLDTVVVVYPLPCYLDLGRAELDDHLRNYLDLDTVFEVCRRHDCRDPDMDAGGDLHRGYHDLGRVAEVYRRRLGCKDDLRLHGFEGDRLDRVDTALILDSNLGEVARNALRLVFRNLKHRAKDSLHCCWKGVNRASGRACLDHKVVGCWKKT